MLEKQKRAHRRGLWFTSAAVRGSQTPGRLRPCPSSTHRGAFPPTALDWTALIPLLGPTSAAIARYDGVLAAIPNPAALLLSPLTSQEAVLSSSIEGTHATIGEILALETLPARAICPSMQPTFRRA